MLPRRSRKLSRPGRKLRKLRLLGLLSLLALLGLISFTYGLVSAIAGDVRQLDPHGKRIDRNGTILASDGKMVLAVLRGNESRVVVDSDDIAPVIKQAIVAVEDRRFFAHRGIDVRGIARAVWADVRNKEIVQGGSTITQQFVKNTYVSNERTVSRKLKEAALAWQLERSWSKDRILTAYLNTIYFGNSAYGVQMAARAYFDKSARDLTLPEAALLAGLPASPAAYDPVANPSSARARRATVLRIMLDEQLVTRARYRKALRAPLPRPENVRLPGTRGPAQYFVEYVKQQLVSHYGSGKVFGGGLRVVTSIDLRLQQIAKESIARWLTEIGGPAAALVALDPRDGRILAMVGGTSFTKSQFNLAVQGERQAGSAFKPIVLATALTDGISPETVYESEPTVINLGDKLWAVSNYEGAYLGQITLAEAMVRSDNSVYAQLTAHVGPRNIRQMAHALGIASPLSDYFAIGLGAEAVNPLELARVYAAFASGGSRIDGKLLGNLPRAVLHVIERGRIDSNSPIGKRVLDPDRAALLTSILEQVVEHGTGWRARLEGRAVAGKTGTTDNYGDAWFVGYTPQLVVSVWVGYPNRLKPMLGEFAGEPVTGGSLPALIWQTFAARALSALDEPAEPFAPARPHSTSTVDVVLREGRLLLDNGSCRETHTVVFFTGFEPGESAPCKPNEVEVPDVVGLTVGEAEQRLLATPLTPRRIERSVRGGERVGIVLEQRPRDGTLSSWQAVELVVPRARHGTVPDVVGLSLRRAQSILAGRDLVALPHSYGEGKPGVVVWQSPRAGVAAEPQLRVRLVIGRG